MTESIILLIVGITVNILIFLWNKKESELPFIQEWKLDEGVSSAEEHRATELLDKYGKQDVITLSGTFLLHENIKEFVEKYATLEFDVYTMDYDRQEFLRGEDIAEWSRGFYCIGGDGGEISFFVRKSVDDEKIYAFDMESSVRPEPYASNIRRFVVMRYNDWMRWQDEQRKT